MKTWTSSCPYPQFQPYLIIMGLDMMKGQQWIWAVQEVNCTGLTLLNFFRFVWPHLTHWAPQSLPTPCRPKWIYCQRSIRHHLESLPVYIPWGTAFFFLSFFCNQLLKVWVTQESSGEVITCRWEGSRHFPFLRLPIRRHPRWQGSWICRVACWSLWHHSGVISTFYYFPSFLELFPLSLTPTVLELGLQITST